MLSKKHLIFLIYSILIIIPLVTQAQQHDPISLNQEERYIPKSCSPIPKDYKTKAYTERDKVQAKTSRSKIAQRAANVVATVESIHSVAVNWTTGGFQSFSIGTSPDSNSPQSSNIRYGQGLGNQQKTTWGYSLKELQREASIENPYVGTPNEGSIDVGTDFYIHLRGEDNWQFAPPVVIGPLQFNWEELGQAGTAVTVNIETNYGVNGAGSFAQWQSDRMRPLYDVAIPIIERIFGAPPRSHTLNIVNDANAVGTNTFYNGPNRISSSYSENGYGDMDQPRLMIHELIHGWRDNITLSMNDEWHYEPTLSGFEEGMAEAVALIVMDEIIANNPGFFNADDLNRHWGHSRGMPFDWDYDFQNHEQLSTTDFFSSDIGTGAHWERYGTSSGAFYKMYIEDPDFFKNFNTEYYNRLNADHDLISSRALIVDIIQTVLPEVERENTTDWINDQYIFDCEVTPGKKIHMLSFHGADDPRNMGHDNRLHVIETQNLPDANEWGWDVFDVNGNMIERWFHQLNNLNGTVEINNYDGTLIQSINVRNDKSGGGTWRGPYQGPNTGPDFNNGPGTTTGIDGHPFYTTSADYNNGTGGIYDSSWFRGLTLPDPNNQVVYDLRETGLYTYNISFTDPQGGPITGKYYRLHGDDFINKDGIYVGVRNNADTPVTGKMFVEQKDDVVAQTADEEPEIIINNGAFQADRIWASVPAVGNRQAGRADRRYSKPGKVHAIFVDDTNFTNGQDGTTLVKKIDFRNITFGSGLSGVQMFLFNTDNFGDITFTDSMPGVLCEGKEGNFSVSNNYPDILDTDSRVTYSWKHPNGSIVSTDKEYTITAVAPTDAGTYELTIEFFGYTIVRTGTLTVESSLAITPATTNQTVCENNAIDLDVVIVGNIDTATATYSWTGPNGFTSTLKNPQVTTDAQAVHDGTYTVNITAKDCDGITDINDTADVVVTVTNKTTPTFTVNNSYCENDTANTLPTTSDNSITGTWNPTTISTTIIGDTNYVFTPDANQCANPLTLTVNISDKATPVFTLTTAYCEDDTANALPTSDNNSITGTWTPATISTTIIGDTDYTFTPAGTECAEPLTITVTITDKATPVFTLTTAYCEDDTANALPTADNNGITGTWAPATISTTTIGDTDYTFTPAGTECAEPLTVTVTITDKATPVFTLTTAYCEDATANALPTADNNGITGTWAPTTISTTTIGNTDYTFTPAGTECADPLTVTVNITDKATPVFTLTTSYCEDDTANALPTADNNGITGTWAPATISTTTIGNTDYIFTPAGTECADPLTVTVNITNKATPVFTVNTSYNENDTPDTLPTSDNNGITGTWAPATISTTIIGDTDYTFTPAGTECAEPLTITVTITDKVTPVFTLTTSYCEDDTANTLPTTDNNGITGTWNPATISTTTIGDTDYTFTPAPTEAADPLTVTITITNKATPVFTLTTSYCEDATANALPTSDNNSITGTWTPATISTTTIGNTDYIFTPAGTECADPLTVTVTITNKATPVFTLTTSYCEDATANALPTSDNNGITGTWAPATISTTTIGNTDYIFTPAGTECADPLTVNISISNKATPVFGITTSYHENDTPDTLPTSDNNGITGTWAPATISTTTIGDTDYIFTPAGTECADPLTLTVNIVSKSTPIFSVATSYCEDDIADTLPASDNSGITGTWAPATISTTTIGNTDYTFTPAPTETADPLTITVNITDKATPVFTLTTSYCEDDTANALPTSDNNGITGTWAPATISTTTIGNTDYIFTPAGTECADTLTVTVNITDKATPVFTLTTSYCEDDTANALPTADNNGITGTWAPTTISTTTIGDTDYTFTPAGTECADPLTVTVNITDKATPVFTLTTTYCEDDTANALPTSDNNGITGTWAPTTISTTIIGNTDYVFTPTGTECADPLTVSVTVNATVTPIFSFTTTYCETTTANALPATSDNGIDGTWNVANIDTNTIGNTDYVFTPNVANQCGEPTTVSVTVNATVTPTFSFATTYCEATTANALPTTSDNGIDGTWNVSSIDTNITGNTNYVFTPNVANQCGEPTTVSVTVNATVTPTFSFTTTYCEATTADALPTTSDNGIDGTWNNTSIDTNITGATNYIFTPNIANQCGEPTTVSVTVNATVTPAFSFTTTYCETTTADALPTTSDNGIDGTWNVANIDTNTIGNTDYVFTPNVANQCGEPTTVSVTVNATVTPTFSFATTYCEANTANTLPTTSDNGIDGTWNVANIDTNTLGLSNYTFTPNVANQCGEPTMVSVTVNATVTPTFSFATTYCEANTADALPTTSDNGINGTWNNTSIDTNITGATNYIFTPNVASQCGEATTVSVTVNATVTPAFSFTTTYCETTTADALPTTSDNGIDGTWNVANIDTNTIGNTDYVFTPNVANQCGEPTTVSVTVNATVTPTFSFATTYCEANTANTLPTTSDNGIDGTWNVSSIDTNTLGLSNYTFTPNVANQCGEPTMVSVTVNATVTPTFSFATTYCEANTADALPTTSDNGINGTWNNTSIDTNITGATNYIFTPNVASQCGEPTTVSVTVNATVTPAFSFTTTYCETTTADALPATSDNGIDGTWNVANIDTNTIGNTDYVFTPNVANQCGEPTTVSVTVNATVTPTFSFATTYCEATTANTLPTTSDNGIDGTWNVANIDTNTLGLSNYTFTPNVANQCGEPTTVSVTVNATVTPTFSFTTTYCEATTVTTLPTTSDNGIDGTWNNTSIDTNITGATNYIFTPNVASQCGEPTTVSVTVNATVTPAFSFTTTYCETTTADALPTTSDNGIDGTWNVANIDTNTIGNTDYVFTPNVANQCGEPTTVSVTVNATVTPTFSFTTTYCETTTADALPTTSDNGIDGTWNVANIDTNTLGLSNYTFTPNVANQCGEPTTVSVTVNATVTPTFSFTTTYCEGTTVTTLPTTSDNGIDGTWNNTSIDTNITGATNYTFTPNVANQCGEPITVSVTVNATVTPTFSFTTTYCEATTADALPITSDNGIDGTWNNTSIDTNITGATNYIFTPNVPSQCGEPITVSVTVNATVTPTFSFATTYCEGTTVTALPTTSDNGIDGTWDANISTSIVETKDYIFTPNNASQCSEPTTVSVTIESNNDFTLTPINDIDICEGESIVINTNDITNATYQWFDQNNDLITGQNTKTLTILNAMSDMTGEYKVTVTAVQCSGVLVSKDTKVNVLVKESFKVNTPTTLTTCYSETISISLNDVIGATYSWTGPNNFTSTDRDIIIPTATLEMAGDYKVSVTAPNCFGTIVTKTSKTIVTVNVCEEMPLFFTPNEDGHNDVWEINSNLIPFEFVNVYDRYGKLIKQITPEDNTWDGYSNGMKMPSTDYWYLVQYTNKKQDTGHFSLLRK
ncbi:T9SS type B sorting domain-containing protein [Tenacibaculum salmonis]|uniref:T9SS type B sorting domain-containing protein n=1 Tax=Tenacibaculum sp. P3-BQ1 TaxID=3232310 RepID=UPI0034DF565F